MGFVRAVRRGTISSLLLPGAFLVLFVSGFRPAIGQSSETDALRSKLEHAMEVSFGQSDSYTIEGKKETEIVKKEHNLRTNQVVEMTTRYEDPYISQEGKITIESMVGQQGFPFRLLGKLGDDGHFFMNVEKERSSKWTDISNVSQNRVRLKVQEMIKEVRNPQKLVELIKNLQSKEKETIRDTSSLKLTASIRRKKMQQRIHDALKKSLALPKGKITYGASVQVRNGSMVFWIASDSNRILRTTFEMEQFIRIRVNMPRTKYATKKHWTQFQRQKLDYMDYDDTKISQAKKNKYQSLLKESKQESRPDEKTETNASEKGQKTEGKDGE